MPRSATRCRSRSVSTRVFPDPAGAMILAGPDRWTTAASWSGASAGTRCWPRRPTVGFRPGGPFRPGGAQGVRHSVAGESERAGLGVPPVHDGEPGCQPGRMGGTTVDEDRGAVGQRDVGVVARPHSLVGEAASGLASVPPDDLAAAGVVGIGPHQELQAFELELEGGGQGVRWVVAALSDPELVGTDPQLDHHRAAVGPGGMERVDRLARARQRRRVDHETRCRPPRVWGRGPRAAPRRCGRAQVGRAGSRAPEESTQRVLRALGPAGTPGSGCFNSGCFNMARNESERHDYARSAGATLTLTVGGHQVPCASWSAHAGRVRAPVPT